MNTASKKQSPMWTTTLSADGEPRYRRACDVDSEGFAGAPELKCMNSRGFITSEAAIHG